MCLTHLRRVPADDATITGRVSSILLLPPIFNLRHTAKRIFERLRDEYGFDGGYTTVKDYVREHRRQTREMFVPLSHAPGHAQCDFGEALVAIGGVERKPESTDGRPECWANWDEGACKGESLGSIGPM